jgi:hypothetical protein
MIHSLSFYQKNIYLVCPLLSSPEPLNLSSQNDQKKICLHRRQSRLKNISGSRKLPTEASRSLHSIRPRFHPPSSFRDSGAIITRRHLLKYLECIHQKESATTTLHAGVMNAERKDQSIHPNRHTELSEIASLPPHFA